MHAVIGFTKRGEVRHDTWHLSLSRRGNSGGLSALKLFAVQASEFNHINHAH
jgi:hypothetical protein